ncbi:MAG: PKD domain-containing protein [Candidatus Bipolaricaulota bacterium]|nr:PKD domain-containing protein [Candidatus Bipolaricaulota bacterium]
MRNRVVLLSGVSLALLALASCVYLFNVSPVASFTAAPVVGVGTLDVTLDATASYDPDGTITSYLWAFGDSQTASQISNLPFTHLFTVQTEPETFTIVLTVTDNQGATDTAVQHVTVDPL